ncbi:hypothetical protein [Micrococcus luteus]|uniref:hypothetical protein n=1 Tax=Micrococcus luteus TaxID=1270 RepID=UPI0033268FB4
MTEPQLHDVAHAPPAPCPDWCRTTHRDGQPGIHQRNLITIDGPPRVVANLLQGVDRKGAPTKPVVHIDFNVDDQTKTLAINPYFAELLGELLGSLTSLEDLGALTAALGRPYRLTTPTP